MVAREDRYLGFQTLGWGPQGKPKHAFPHRGIPYQYFVSSQNSKVVVNSLSTTPMFAAVGSRSSIDLPLGPLYRVYVKAKFTSMAGDETVAFRLWHRRCHKRPMEPSERDVPVIKSCCIPSSASLIRGEGSLEFLDNQWDRGH